MIIIGEGNIFDIMCDAVVNPVNCKGVMGAGLAKQFKIKYPSMFQAYKHYCEMGTSKPGDIFVWHYEACPYIINAFVKDDWKQPSRYMWIELVIKNIKLFLREHPEIKSIAVPKLGCGLGKLDWDKVKPIMIKEFESVADMVDIYIKE